MTTTNHYVPFSDGTDQGHDGREDTDEHDDALAELVATVRDTIDIGEPCEPDGDWLRETDRPLRKAFSNQANEFDERVVLESPGLTAGWRVVHQRQDGKAEILTDDGTLVDRETAYALAERCMADLAGVQPGHRTGRAIRE